MQRLVLAYKNFAAHQNISHIGLGVSALNTCKVLRRGGIIADVWPVVNAKDLTARLQRDPATHVVVSAPWIPSVDIHGLVSANSSTRFAVNCHSNVGFLQADSNGVRLVREAMDVEAATHNFHLAGNSIKFCKWIRSAYTRPCTYLPNSFTIWITTIFRGGLFIREARCALCFRRHAALEEFQGARPAQPRNHAPLQSQSRVVALSGAHRRRRRHHPPLCARHAGQRSSQRQAGRNTDGRKAGSKFRQSVAHMHLLKPQLPPNPSIW